MDSNRRLLPCLLLGLFLVPLTAARADHDRPAGYRLTSVALRVRDSALRYERTVCGCHHLRAERLFAQLAVKRAERLVETLHSGAPWGRVWGDYAVLNAQLRVIERRTDEIGRHGHFDPAVARAWERLHCDWRELDEHMAAFHGRPRR